MSITSVRPLPAEAMGEVLSHLEEGNKFVLRLVCKDWNDKVSSVFLSQYNFYLQDLPETDLRSKLVEILHSYRELCHVQDENSCMQICQLRKINCTIRLAYRELGVEFLIGDRPFIHASDLVALERSRQTEHDLALTLSWPAMRQKIKEIEDLIDSKLEIPAEDAPVDEIRRFMAANPSSLAAVKGLEICGTNQNSIPLEINFFTGVTNLTYSGNEIYQIPKMQLCNLTRLNLNSNAITTAQNLEGLPHLTTLLIDENKISALTNLDENTKIKTIFAYRNQIVDISGLSKLVNLENLYISENLIMDPTPLSELPNLRFVHLQYNKINYFPHFKNAESLKFLYLTGNPFPTFQNNNFNENYQESAVAYHRAHVAVENIVTLTEALANTEEKCVIS